MRTLLWVLVVVVVMAGALIALRRRPRTRTVDGVEGFRRHMDALLLRGEATIERVRKLAGTQRELTWLATWRSTSGRRTRSST
ncbi:MAG: hypothetical protein R2715_06050 [Ilumatobacteraceae bacterium]